MATIPSVIDGAQVLVTALLAADNLPTRRTRHFARGNVVPVPAALVIARYEDSGEVYLFHCDASWKTITDTLHDSVSEAKAQAEFEFLGTLNWSEG